MPSLADWFDHDYDEATYAFTLSTVVPNCDRPALVEALAGFMSANKADPEVTADLLAAVGWDTAIASLRKGRIAVRRGDFAEVLAAEAAEAFDALVVPVRKLRYQIDPNQTLPGSDVVGLAMDGEAIEDLEFVESKYRTDPGMDIAVDAHDQLAADRENGYATTVNFLAHRLRELDEDLYDRFIEFLADRDVKDSRHTVALTYDETHWDDEIPENLNDLPELLPELWLRRFPLEGAVQLVEEIYAQLLWDVISDE